MGIEPGNPEDKDHITKIDVVFRNDPFTESSLNGLVRVDRTVGDAMASGGPLAGATLKGLGGSTAMVNDLRSVTISDQRKMYVLVTAGVFLILWALIRRPLICMYLIATVVLGYLASLGITETRLPGPAQRAVALGRARLEGGILPLRHPRGDRRRLQTSSSWRG